MTIGEAIEINGGLIQSVTAGIDEEEKEAIQLGIEALKRLKEDRYYEGIMSPKPLPGETTD